MSNLADKDAIRDVLMRYCRGVDRLDAELLRDCYHADSTDDHGHWKGNGHDFAAFIVASLAARAHHTTHSVANVLIEFDGDDGRDGGDDGRDGGDGDVAHVESYAMAFLRRTEAGAEWLDQFAGRYLDRFERRAGTWRIARRVVVHDWSVTTKLDPSTSFPLPMEGFTQGRRDRSDLVYIP